MNELLANTLSPEELADLLSVKPEIIVQMEKEYKEHVLDDVSDNFFELNAKQASQIQRENSNETADISVSDVTDRIITNLIADTIIWKLDDKGSAGFVCQPDLKKKPVTIKEIQAIPKGIRPQLTESLMHVDIAEPSSKTLLKIYKDFTEEPDAKKKQLLYHTFRQGLDILDIDPIVYRMIFQNPNSMSHWLPEMVRPVQMNGFFKIPATTIAFLPETMLQLTRNDYFGLTPTTLDIVNRWATSVFSLKPDGDYFVKTGTYSSKFDFRNAHVTTPEEVAELGQYLLYIHFQALQMASPISTPCIYGACTTTEWVVRDFIPDRDGNPTIYKGLPLRTEYRVFVDFDTDEILGISPYWEPRLMKSRFLSGSKNSPHDKHDYLIYLSHEKKLMKRYEESKDKILENIRALLPDVDLGGQWSIDIMQNGEGEDAEFWLIDMATADTSALKECVSREKLQITKENWIPENIVI